MSATPYRHASPVHSRLDDLPWARRAVLLGGLIAGTLDIGVAALIFQASPALILRGIAGGVLGAATYSGGTYSSMVGLALQWAMSIAIAAIYVGASLWLPLLRRRPMVCGLAYGIPVFFVMNFVVVPLSRVAHRTHFTPRLFVLNLLAMLLFGLIIAVTASRVEASARRTERN